MIGRKNGDRKTRASPPANKFLGLQWQKAKFSPAYDRFRMLLTEA
jgi:hypothetical protein